MTRTLPAQLAAIALLSLPPCCLVAEPTSQTRSGAAVFVSPQNGAIVRPGELLHIEISITSGKIVDGSVLMVSPLGFSNEMRESPPYSFTMSISHQDTVGAGRPLIGKHSITAFGSTRDRLGLGAVEVDVEEDEMPKKLSIYSNMSSQYGPPGLTFYDAGSEQTLDISGEFPNGDEFNLVNSTFLRLTSENPKVVKIGPEGWVTAFGPGHTSITATYTLGEQTMRTSIPVSVTVPRSNLVISPLSLDFGDQRAGTSSQPLEVTLTNDSDSPITIYKLEVRAEVRETDDCTSAPLAPGDTCTISVVYVPNRAGSSVGIIYIPNSHTGTGALPISGNGI